VEFQQQCLGVDGARSGWIAVWREHDSLHHQRYESAKALVDSHRSFDVIAVDIPIGLTDSHGREAEFLARKFVGGRRACSLFSTPVRGILDAQSQPEASRRHREIDGRGFGAQSFAILCKIREWDELLQGDERARAMVREIHPEVSFAALNGGQGCGLSESKKSDAGASARVDLLSPYFGARNVERLVRDVPRREAARDDVLDALVALWSAERIATGRAVSLPHPVPQDATGLGMSIWY
jgi:predicted RNase H-like nuclease